MLTRERLIAFLRKEGQFVAGDQFTDSRGLACWLGCTTRTLRRWGEEGRGPPARYTTRVVYDLDEISAWYDSAVMHGTSKSLEKV
jgi:hypothetical protein